MPTTVPRYGASPQIAETATPFVPERSLASGQLFGGGAQAQEQLGRGLQVVGDSTARIAVDIQRRDNADQVFRAETALRDDYMAYEKGVLEKRGRDAYGVSEQSKEWWDDAVKRHSEGLTNPEQQRLFQHQAQPMRQSSIDTLSRHESTQRRESVTQSATADITSSINRAAAHPLDATIQGDTRATIERNVGAVAALNGWTPEQRQAAMEQHLTNLHMGVIGAQVDTMPDSARAYYEAHKDEIDGTQHAKIEKTLEIGGLKKRSQSATDDIMAKAGNETEALQMAREQFSGEDEDAVVARIHERFNEREAVKNQGYKDASDAAWKILDENGYSLDAIPASVLSSMDPEARARMQDYVYNRAKTNAADMNTNWSTYDKLMTMAATDPKAFLESDPNTWRQALATKEYDEMLAVRKATLLAQGKTPPTLYTANAMVDSYLKQMGLVGPRNAENAGYIKAQFMSAFAARQAMQPEKKLSDTEMQAVADGVIKHLSETHDPHLQALAAPESRTQRNRAVSQYAGTITKGAKGRELTGLQKEFSSTADTVLDAAEQRKGSPLTDIETKQILDKLTRYGQVQGSGALYDDRGYYFQFIGRDDYKNFQPDN